MTYNQLKFKMKDRLAEINNTPCQLDALCGQMVEFIPGKYSKERVILDSYKASEAMLLRRSWLNNWKYEQSELASFNGD